jgi:RNA polymerase sigma factor (sigma-70 family)
MATTPAHPVTRYVRQFAAGQLAAALSDAQLLERFAGRGDEAAFAALVRRHGPLVLGACRRVLEDWHAAQDCFQATFLVLARKAAALKRPEALGPWLYGVACRTARKARAQEVRRRACEREAARTPAVEHPDELARRDLGVVLDEAVGRLPEKYRVPFVLHHLQGVTVAEVARRLGCPQGTIAAHLARAKQRLRVRLARRGVIVSGGALLASLSENAAPACVPMPLVARAVEAAALAVAGKVASGGTVSAEVVALTKGALRVMGTKLRIAVGLLLAVTVAGVGAGGALYQTRAAQAGPEPTAGMGERAEGSWTPTGTADGARPLSLADLQRLALSNSPLIRQAVADVEAARGATTQAGALTLDLRLAELALRRAEADLSAEVRSGYGEVLSARENLRVARERARQVEDAFRAEGGSAGGGSAPTGGAVVRQARAAVVQARNREVMAWKQLAATVGLPALPAADLVGRLDPPPSLPRYNEALAQVLDRHTDVLAAQCRVQRAREDLRQAKATPTPDNANSTPGNVAAQAGDAPFPVWDGKKGNVLKAQAALVRATEEEHRVRKELTARLAEAYAKYESNRRLVELCRDQILPDQVRVYRRVCRDRQEGPGRVTTEDLLNAHQALTTATTTSNEALRETWMAISAVTALLQTEEPWEGGEGPPAAPDRGR